MKAPLIHVLKPFKVVKAQRLETLEKRIREAIQGKECERVFIRADPVETQTARRAQWWNRAPRGNIDMRTGKISWITPPKSLRKYKFLLYTTKSEHRIKKRGEIYVRLDASGKMRSKIAWVRKRSSTGPWPNSKIEGKEVTRQLNAFLKIFASQGYEFGSSRLRFVQWEGEKGIEFYDFLNTEN